ncbi:hypothetical protein C5167_026403 [Papaver somniferum]|uniref:mucin-2-like n=1 Tax=Papaver somniferum TaxID=3469 RepID=UPI000E704C28|nr:mucin-2-like [Papaver somniferum]RZC85730.1 hypothetical protein C5167_026403 [Papaver somniferum]
MGRGRMQLNGASFLMLFMIGAIAEAARTPPGIANNPPNTATCHNTAYKECHNLVHVCPKFCDNGCHVNCRSCKPICGPDDGSSDAPPEDSTPPPGGDDKGNGKDKTPPVTAPSVPAPSPPIYPTPPTVPAPTPPVVPAPSPPVVPTPPAEPIPSPPITPTPPSEPTPSPPVTPTPTPPIYPTPPTVPSPPIVPTPTPSPPFTPTPPAEPIPSPPVTPTPPSEPIPSPPVTPTPPSEPTPSPPVTPTPPAEPTPSPPVTPTPPSEPIPSPPVTPTPPSDPTPSPPVTPTPPAEPVPSPPVTPTPPSEPIPSPPVYPTPPSEPTPPPPVTPTPPSEPTPSPPVTPTPPSEPTPSPPVTPTPPSEPTPPSPVYPTPPSSPTPTPTSPSTPPSSDVSAKRRRRCRNPKYSQCYNVEHVCPAACPTSCMVDCATCKPMCNCDQPGAVCQDPRFIGGDGNTFYFHGKQNRNFCLLSDSNLHINAHFIGKRNQNMKRDFTWVQAIGVLFNNHKIYVGARETAMWDDSVDRLGLSFDGQPIYLPESEGAKWQSEVDPSVTITRSSVANKIIVEVEGSFKITANVVPITEEESRVHKYGISKDNCFAHLDLGFKFYSLSDNVNGVLGQTYANEYVSKVKMGASMPVMAGDDKFITSSIFANDCSVARYTGIGSSNRGFSSEYASVTCSSGIDGRGVVCKR